MTFPRMQFNRVELAGSLGDLGTLLPITIGMIMVNGVSAIGTFYAIGLFYIIAGAYFRIPIAVQPMKVIGAYSIATAMTASQISGATALVGIFLLVLGITGAITYIGRIIPTSVVRGVQLSTGILLISQGLKFMLGNSPFQLSEGMAEPYLTLQQMGPIPLGLLIGLAGMVLTLYLLNSKRFPAALMVISFGLLVGMLLGTHEGFDQFVPGLYLPSWLPHGLPASSDLSIALFVLVLPQMPMTVGNAVIASADLSHNYFDEAAKRVTYKSLTLSMACASGLSFLIGGIPLCHGAGGLAAHYRFGARTSGSNLIIGLIFITLALFLGPHALAVIHLLPMSILGVLLIFSGAQLGLTILDMFNRKDMFVVLMILSITLTSSLAWGFLAGTILAYILRSEKVSV